MYDEQQETAPATMRAARIQVERAVAGLAGMDGEPWKALRAAGQALREGEEALARCQGRRMAQERAAADGDPPVRTEAIQEIAELRVATKSLDALLAHLSAYVVSALDAADGASVTLLTPGSLGATGPDIEAADRAQYELGEGPCYEAIRTGALHWTGRAAADPRWPRLSAAMREPGGFGSIVGVPLDTGERVEGVLNVYAARENAFGDTSLRIATILARPVAATLADARAYSEQADLVDGLRQAVESHSRIGRAVGILMVREGLGPDDAFARLRRISNDTNRKLRDVAAAIVDDATPDPGTTPVRPPDADPAGTR